MSVMSTSDIALGMSITFKTLNPHDNVRWAGTVESICKYNTARQFQDIEPYYQEVKRVHSDIASKENLTYIGLNVLENDSHSVMRYFALEWIDPSSLEELNYNNYIDFRVYDINDDTATEILQTLRSMGYITDKVV